MKNIFLQLFLLAIIFQSCKKKDDTIIPSVPAPVACFTVDATESIDSTHSFLFDQCPPAYDLSYWDFDDGQYSSNPNPSHVFNHYGSYNVKLTVTSTTGETNSTTKTITIGHYSLNKIVYTQTTNIILYPKYLNLSPFSVYDSISNTGQLPFTHQFTDGSNFDLIDSAQYIYSEQHNASFTAQGFTVYPSSIINKSYDAVLNLLGDTARFTLQYKIVPR
ncbi:MAG: PKD domain-containing protein [Bacteroidia bacterium]|nr:PKD domain-containing protein [Bacteroidia bacterium]